MSRSDSKHPLILNARRSLNGIKKRLIRECWYIKAMIEKRVSNALIARHSGTTIPSCVLWPNKQKRIYFKNVPRGEFIFEIQHRDSYVAEERKSVVARFGFVTGSRHRKATTEFGLQRGSDGRLFAYMGSGKERDSRFLQSARISIPKFQNWMYVDLELAPDRVVNLEKVRLFRKPENELNIQSAIGRWIERHPSATAATFLIYADIDINVVDGSSIWLSSIASIGCNLGQCILVTKKDVASDIILSNIDRRDNLFLFNPEDMNIAGETLSIKQASEVLRVLDDRLPNIRFLVVRGTDAAAELLGTRQFRGRSVVYLTDFYKLMPEGFTVPPERKVLVDLITSQAAIILTQTSAIACKLKEIAPFPFKEARLPPIIPDALPQVAHRWLNEFRGAIKIGYAGKINPEWGIVELLDWTERARKEGYEIELHIVANKISENAGGKGYPGFRNNILSRMRGLEAQHHQTLNREQSMQLMSDMDYVWCWRPPSLEERTLELSTKLVEMAASGARCLCYPNEINKFTLGVDYPFFIRGYDNFRHLLPATTSPSETTGARIRQEHSLSAVKDRLGHEVFQIERREGIRRICFSGHDMKFVHPYMSYLKSSGYEVVRDNWGWGEVSDLARTKLQQEWADIVFCEWGLANAVWHSQNPLAGKKIFVRVHLQEIGDRAKKLASQIDVANVERVIFVSERVRDEAVGLYGWPVEKTVVIPNFTLTDEYRFTKKPFGGEIRLGIVGVIPQRKRLDRAIDLLAELLRRGHDASLHIKGPRPETIEFMRGPSRRAELDYYYELYRRIDADSTMVKRVHFYPWGNDVAAWYKNIDHILSPSEFESFHYALADGVLAGCHPVVWPWAEAKSLYTSRWVIEDTASAASQIEAFRLLPESEREVELQANRSLVESRYGSEHIFSQLNEVLGL